MSKERRQELLDTLASLNLPNLEANDILNNENNEVQNRSPVEEEKNCSFAEKERKLEENISDPNSLNQLIKSPTLTKSNESNLPSPQPSDSLTDIFQNSVYLQFPSLCANQASAEDVVKLQALMTDYLAMKQTVTKLTSTMVEYSRITERVHSEFQKELFEKSLRIANMQAELDQVQRHREHNFDYTTEEVKAFTDNDHIKCAQHVPQVQILERQNSELFKEKHFEEIIYIKQKLESAEKLIKKMQADRSTADALRNEELAAQAEIYRRDFEMERTCRIKIFGEKQQYIQDLRALQRRNQELMDALAESHKTSKSGSTPIKASFTKSSLRDERFQARALGTTVAAGTESLWICPICSKHIPISVWQTHMNNCTHRI